VESTAVAVAVGGAVGTVVGVLEAGGEVGLPIGDARVGVPVAITRVAVLVAPAGAVGVTIVSLSSSLHPIPEHSAAATTAMRRTGTNRPRRQRAPTRLFPHPMLGLPRRTTRLNNSCLAVKVLLLPEPHRELRHMMREHHQLDALASDR
jgi:hypothetical protein